MSVEEAFVFSPQHKDFSVDIARQISAKDYNQETDQCWISARNSGGLIRDAREK